MLTLYVKTGCPFGRKVLEAADQLGLEVQQKNIADIGFAAELLERGGKRQVPYLLDTEKGIGMYESEDILAYLKEHYGHN